MTSASLNLVRLLQLASPALPVGAYSYSQGLEFAVEDRIVTDERSAQIWIGDLLRFSMGSFEVPLLSRMFDALAEDDVDAFAEWNTTFLAGRETAELRNETVQMGRALTVLMRDLPFCAADKLSLWCDSKQLTFPASFAFAAHHMEVDRNDALQAYLWSWLENQVMAAIKAIPLGQTAGQRMLAEMSALLPDIALQAAQMLDQDLSNFAPGLAIASSRHETQYSRLFRS